MATAKHRIQVIDGSSAGAFSDRVVIGQALSVANAAGGGPGATVSTVVTFPEPLPPVYQVAVDPKQAAAWWITARTPFGFTVNIAPLLAGTTLSAGTIDVSLIG